jgi:hypothetical protein
MNDPFYHKLLEASWRRKLTPTEQADLQTWLAAHPEVRADWEAEMGLNRLLRDLPEAPVPSNFTARVLQAAERDVPDRTSVAARRGGWQWPLRSFWARAAMAGMAVTAGLLAYRETYINSQLKLAQKAKSVAAVSEVSSLPGPDALLNFEAVRQLNSGPAVDRGLLTVFSYLQ